jgi:ABC-type branched-subunit amino acid transport system ATPase component
MIQQKRNELVKWMKKYDDLLLYVYKNKDNKDKVRDKLYELYPDLKRLDEGTDKQD